MGLFSKASTVLHIQDFEVDAAFNLGLLKVNFVKKLANIVESLIMKQFTLVSSISKRMIEKARDKGVEETKLFYLPNWADLSSELNEINQALDPQRCSYRTNLKIPPKAIVAMYSGNMGEKQGLEILALVAKRIACNPRCANNIHFVFCGNGTTRKKLELACLGIESVHFMDLQPIKSLNNLLSFADIHLLPQKFALLLQK